VVLPEGAGVSATPSGRGQLAHLAVPFCLVALGVLALAAWWLRSPIPAVSSVKSRSVAPPLGAIPSAKQAEQLCSALHVLPGARMAACCSVPPDRNLYEECVKVVSRALASSSIELDASAIAGCERARQQQLRGCDWVRPGLPLAPDACQGLVQGRVPLGGACRSSLECASSAHCVSGAGAAQGRCTAPAATGAPCGRTTDEMAAYLLDRSVETSHPWCESFCSLTTHQCEPTPAEGAPCKTHVNCGPGQHCDSGVCAAGASVAALAKTGESCRSDLDCARGGCVANGTGGRLCGKRCPATPSL
jgi:hypothetical protein